MADKRVIYIRGPSQRAALKQLADEVDEGWRVEAREPTRSIAQNDLMWSALTDLANQVPWVVNGKEEMLSKEGWKDLISSAVHQEDRMAKGLRGGFVMLGRSTSKMSKKEMAELITFAHSFGAEKGVTWSETSIGRDA